jgi:hypothetical protein
MKKKKDVTTWKKKEKRWELCTGSMHKHKIPKAHKLNRSINAAALE